MSVYNSALAEASFGAHTATVLRQAAALAAAPFATIARSVRVRRTVGQLANLDDRTLADIGLRRTQILSTASQVVDWPHVDPRRLAR